MHSCWCCPEGFFRSIIFAVRKVIYFSYKSGHWAVGKNGGKDEASPHSLSGREFPLFAELNHVEGHQLNSIAFMKWDIFQIWAIGFLSVLGSCNGIICFYFFWLLCLKSIFMGMAGCFLGAVKNGHLWNHNSEFIVLNNILYYI